MMILQQKTGTIGACHALGQCALSPDSRVADGLIGAIDLAMEQLERHARGENVVVPHNAIRGDVVVLEDGDGPVFDRFLLKIMNFVSKPMNFVLKILNFVSKMMDFVFKTMQ